MAMSALADRLLDLALPASCVGCGLEGDPICDACRSSLDVRLEAGPGTLIGLPGNVPAPLLQLDWCAPFSGLIRRAILELKYGGERRLAVPLGVAMADRWRRIAAGGDLLVPVPVHPDRERQRGFDQAVLIAGVAGSRLRLPVIRALARTRSTVAQYRLGRTSRGSNVRGSFELAPGIRGAAVAGRWIILVDDVVTTGATLAACADVLLDAGALGVSAVTVARER